MGIDYGEKRVGIAVSDEGGKMAFPLDVLSNDKRLLQRIKQACKSEKIKQIVIGASKDLAGKDNPIFRDAKEFSKKLSTSIKLPIYWEPEFYTTKEAQRLQGKHGMLDASAAAIILKSFLDKKAPKKR